MTPGVFPSLSSPYSLRQGLSAELRAHLAPGILCMPIPGAGTMDRPLTDLAFAGFQGTQTLALGVCRKGLQSLSHLSSPVWFYF